MALLIVRDVKQGRDRIINTNFIFHCVEHEGGVRINYSEGGSSARDYCIVACGIDEFARAVGAVRVS